MAKVGESEHHTGLAIDICLIINNKVVNENEELIKQQEVFRTIHCVLHKFGFILRYPEKKKNITGYDYEPWHIRYVGEELASKLYLNNLTLEEYKKTIFEWKSFFIIFYSSDFIELWDDDIDELEELLLLEEVELLEELLELLDLLELELLDLLELEVVEELELLLDEELELLLDEELELPLSVVDFFFITLIEKEEKLETNELACTLWESIVPSTSEELEDCISTICNVLPFLVAHAWATDLFFPTNEGITG